MSRSQWLAYVLGVSLSVIVIILGILGGEIVSVGEAALVLVTITAAAVIELSSERR